ncbi:MAG: DUF262 domain-containing protein [Bacteroidales bacterium]
MNKELVFSIRNIFDGTSTEGALQQYEAKAYYIAPYQRGYKWAAIKSDDAVCVLMKDLFDAAENSKSEYYLQFITTKISDVNKIKVLEVIDGQQRLTTLTILLSILANKLNENNNAISNNLLSYEVRPNVTKFFQEYIYQKINTITTETWENFISQFPDNDEQDIFYLYSAANKINEMISETFSDDKEKIKEFENYLLENVKIILNNIERDIDCEEIFSNLNDNKVELTSSELIKGLILTNSARELPNSDKITYKEIIELRAIMGRQWDEISHWANRKEIKTFFFSYSNNVLDELLFLLAIENGFEESSDISNKNVVFNYFQSQIKKGNQTAKKLFDNLKGLKSVFNEWFNDNEIYNSLGYVFFSKKSPKTLSRKSQKTLRDYLPFIRADKTELKAELTKHISTILDFNISDLEYNKTNTEIHNLLLAISVFGGENRFDFTAFNTQASWSLEHIFPQTPDKLADDLEEKDIAPLKSLYENNLDDFNKVKSLLKEYEETMDIATTFKSLAEKMNKNHCSLSLNEKTILYRLIKNEKLHSIGNMALLTSSDNSSNSNGMFDKKRHNIVKRISGGSFVPKHTYDVFSKLISENMTPDLTIWTATDIDTHFEWINQKINEIKNTK